MKSLFTIHAGEYLVGSYIENNLKKKIKGKTQKTFNVWLPAKDTGIDLLVSNYDNSKTVSLQVKFSKDFISNEWNEILRLGLKSCGWWTLNRNKIKNSNANYWIFVLYNVYSKEEQFVIIKPKTLFSKYFSREYQ